MAYNPDWEPIRNKLVNAYADAWAGLFEDAVNTAYGTQNASIDTSYQPGFLASLYASGKIDAQTLAYYIDYVDPQGNLFMGVLNQMGVYDQFAKELFDTKWTENAEYNIAYCEENGCRDAAMQRFYDKWVRSGQPTTKDGMMSDEDFDKYTAVPNEVDGIVEILRNEGYSDEDIQDLLDSIVDNDNFYGSTVLSNVLRDLGYNEAGEQWDVSPRPGSPCTAEDGTIGQYDNAGGCVSRGIGSEGDPCGYRGEGKKDASGNCVGGEDNCDNPTYAADYVADCSEFGVCEDGTLKTDEDGTNCSEYVDPLTDEEKLVRDYGQEAVDKAKEIYNGIEDWVEGTIEDPAGALKNILDTVYSGMPEECKESNTNKPDDWWKDCTNLSVLGQIPGLPIPLPPGTIDVNTTVRDLEDAAKEAGKTLEDIFNPTCTGTPAEIQECENRTISDIIGDWASDIWDDIKGAWEDLEDKTEQGLINILIDAGYNILSGWILTQVKDAVSTDNPLAFVPLENCVDQAWLEQASPEQKALCNNVVNCEEQGLTGGWVRDVDLCGPPVNGYCADGVTIKDNAEGTNCEEYSEFGFCEDGVTKKADELGTNCEEYAEFGFCEDEVTKKADAEGTNCTEYKEPFDCSSVGRKPPEGGEEATSANDCGSCIDTSLEPNNVGNCEEPAISQEEQDCIDKGRVWDGVTETCEDNCVNTQHVVDTETGECGPEEFVNTGPDKATCAGRGKSFVPADEATGTPSSCGDCVEEGWTHGGVGTNCVDPDPDPNNCAAQGKTLNEDKSCGECTEEGWTSEGPGVPCKAPEEVECNAETATSQVNLTETIPFGDPLPDPSTTYEDDGTQCVATTTTYVQGEEPQDCASLNRKQVDEFTCGPCLADYREGAEGCVPETCEDKGLTTSLVDGSCKDCSGEITRDNFRDCGYKFCGSGVYVPQDEECGYTGVCDDGLEAEGTEGCFPCPENTPNAGKSMSSPEACGEPIVTPVCADGSPKDANGNCPEDYCSDGVTLISEGCPPTTVDPDECLEITSENAEKCGQQLCNGVYIDKNLPCVPVVVDPEGCEDPAETDFGKGAGCEKPCPDNANIGISDAACGDTPVTTCLDETATNFNEEGPCVYGPIVETCLNGATDYPECTTCADGGLPDADLGCGGIDDPCADPVYAAENPQECASGPDCVDCTCAEYAAANPEECIGTPPPPPEGGGGGGFEAGERDPLNIGIAGDPELKQRLEFPITDYLTGLFTGRG